MEAFNNLAGVATSLFKDRNELRVHVTLDTIRSFQRHNVPLILSDGGSHPAVIEQFSQAGAIIAPAKRPGLLTQLLDGVACAQEQFGGGINILKLEPEKSGLLDAGLKQIAQALEQGVDILHIGRTEYARSTLPVIQDDRELAGSAFMELMGLPRDALSGGRAYSPRGLKYLQALEYFVEKFGNSFNNWLYLYVASLEAMKLRLYAEHLPSDTLNELRRLGTMNVEGILIDMVHPAVMKDAEDDDPLTIAKRDEQLVMQILWLARLYMDYPAVDRNDRVVLSRAYTRQIDR